MFTRVSAYRQENMGMVISTLFFCVVSLKMMKSTQKVYKGRQEPLWDYVALQTISFTIVMRIEHKILHFRIILCIICY